MKKSSSLNATFYFYFIVFIVVPILLVLIIVLRLEGSLMQNSAFSKLEAEQENMANLISSEISDASLKFTHFLLVNDRQALELAEKIASEPSEERYFDISQMKELYNFVVTPSSDIIAVHFYEREGGSIIELKSDLAFSIEELKKYDFYGEALTYPGHTSIGLIDKSFIYSRQKTSDPKQALVVSFCPDTRDGKVEMICWYTNVSGIQRIENYKREASEGEIYLADEEGRILVGSASEEGDLLPEDMRTLSEGKYNFRRGGYQVNVLVTRVPNTKWKIVSVVETSVILRSFYRMLTAAILTSIVIFTLFFIFSRKFLHSIINPINLLKQGMSDVEEGKLDTRVAPAGQKEIRALMSSFNSMTGRIRDLLFLTKQQQREKMKAEISALQSQINPHFLVNTLNSIRFTAMVSKFDSIKNMAEALIKILSASFKDPDKTYSIANEIEILESYVYLMKIRYSENFDVIWKVEDKCLNCSIPRLLIQPVVENAIVHGFEDREDPGTISINIYERGRIIFIQVEDNGKGMKLNETDTLEQSLKNVKRQGHGIGLANTDRRIKLNYGDEYGITLRSEVGKGSIVTITIPAIEEEKNV